jgi:hypothetical protein
MLLVPPNIWNLSSSRVVVAWSGTREAMRAVRGSMPFLQGAEKVIIVSFEGGSGLRLDNGIADYLNNCGIDVRFVHPRSKEVSPHIFSTYRAMRERI